MNDIKSENHILRRSGIVIPLVLESARSGTRIRAEWYRDTTPLRKYKHINIINIPKPLTPTMGRFVRRIIAMYSALTRITILWTSNVFSAFGEML